MFNILNMFNLLIWYHTVDIYNSLMICFIFLMVCDLMEHAAVLFQ